MQAMAKQTDRSAARRGGPDEPPSPRLWRSSAGPSPRTRGQFCPICNDDIGNRLTMHKLVNLSTWNTEWCPTTRVEVQNDRYGH